MVSATALDLTGAPTRVIRPCRVLLIAPQPFFAVRGTPINVRQMARTLCSVGCEVHLATYGLGEPAEIDGLRVHRAPALPGVHRVPIGFSVAKLLMDGLLALRVWGLLLRYRFDVVHAVEESVFFTLPAARLRGTPVIYDMDSSIPDQLEYGGVLREGVLLRGVRAIERAAVRQASLVITVCRALTEHVRAVDARIPVAQIEDCPLEEALREPDPRVVDELRRRFGLAGAPVVVYTGNLERYQGVDLLLGAFPSVAVRHPDARLLIVGGERAQIEAARAIVAARGIADRVVFAGRQPPRLMAEFMALGTALVSPRRDGTNTPLKLFSYMYSGVPIIATDLPTHTQVLDSDTALLCPPAESALADAMVRVLDDPSAYCRLGAAARERVVREHSPESFARKLLESYAAVLGDAFSSVATSM